MFQAVLKSGSVWLTGWKAAGTNHVWSPLYEHLIYFLFALYTADCRSTDESCPLVKFAADDTEPVGKISNDEDTIYHKQTENSVNWGDKNYLYLNVSNAKEMCIDFRKNQRCPKPVYIKGEAVDTYKYLGVVFALVNWTGKRTTTLCWKKWARECIAWESWDHLE